MPIEITEHVFPYDSQGNEIPLSALSNVDLILVKRVMQIRHLFEGSKSNSAMPRGFNVIGNNLGPKPFIYLQREFETSRSLHTIQSLNSRILSPWHVYIGPNMDDRVDNWEALAEVTYADDGIIFGLTYQLEKHLETLEGIG